MADSTPVLDEYGLDTYDYLIKQYMENKIDESLGDITDTLDKLVNGGLPEPIT